MPTFTSEQDYLDSVKPRNFTSGGDYEAPKDDARLNTVKGMGRGQQMIDAAAYQQRRMTNSIKQAWYKLSGNKEQVNDLQKIMDHEDKVYEQYLRSEHNPHRTAAAVGSLAGALTHPLSMATMPLGGGSTIGGRALYQGLYGGVVEGLTNPGGLGDRIVSGAAGTVGGAVGSAGSDAVAKGLSGLRGKWEDPIIKKANNISKEYGLEPGVGQLREYRGRIMSPDELKARGGNWPYSIEKHATHTQEVDARKLKAALGHSKDSSVSKALPKVDAKDLTEELTKESEAIWKPFNKAARKSKETVRPDELWNSLKDIKKHNSALLTDKSAIPDDVVREQIDKIVNTEDWIDLPKYSPEEYAKITSELGNAAHRVKILSTGQTPTYDGEAGKRVSEAFGNAKNDMAAWGKKDPSGFASWEKAIADYQENILTVRSNPILKSAQDLNDKGRDLHKIMDTASEGTNYDHVRDLLKQYNDRGMVDAANRLDLLDANSLATAHGASGATPITGNLPKVKSNDALSLLGDGYAFVANRPSVKGLYFGDPKIPDLEKSGILNGALGSMIRRSPISASREFGGEEATILKALYELMPWVGDDEKPLLGGNDSGTHSPGSATQLGVQR